MEDQRERNAETLAALEARIERSDELKAHFVREIARLDARLDEHEVQWRVKMNLPPRSECRVNVRQPLAGDTNNQK